MAADENIVVRAQAIVALAKAQGTHLTDQQCELEVNRTLKQIAMHEANMHRNTAEGHADIDRRYYRGMRAWRLSRVLAVMCIFGFALIFYYDAVDNVHPPGMNQIYYHQR